MDVFGPVADNSNGIGEMGYDREEMGEENYKRARQILADLDAVGNTTKAETKGIAIGSAVIAAVSLFASFIAVIAVGSESKIGEMTTAQYLAEAGKLSSGSTLCVYRHAYRRVRPLLVQLDADPRRSAARVPDRQGVPAPVPRPGNLGRHQDPDYGRVVNICTAAAQRELIRPGLLAIMMPILVAIYLGVRPRRLPRRDDRGRPAPGRLHGQRRWRLGQRQEADRGRPLRRQRFREPTRRALPATPSATRSRTPPARP